MKHNIKRDIDSLRRKLHIRPLAETRLAEVKLAVAKTKGDKLLAATLLGIGKTTVYRILAASTLLLLLLIAGCGGGNPKTTPIPQAQNISGQWTGQITFTSIATGATVGATNAQFNFNQSATDAANATLIFTGNCAGTGSASGSILGHALDLTLTVNGQPFALHTQIFDQVTPNLILGQAIPMNAACFDPAKTSASIKLVKN